jgi:hypothetical protein
MKHNKIIIYDDSCPLCAAYTKGFVAAGMIKKENRKSFTTIEPQLLELIDTKRCPDEIPVIDLDSKEVFYGVDALIEILMIKFHFVKKITNVKFIRWMLVKLYKLISYNRRVIVAVNPRPGNFDCTPDFNYGYRLAFMVIFLLFNSYMLLPIHLYILQDSFVSISSTQLEVAHLVLVALNISISFFLNKKIAFEYLGQVNMLALTTILATIPVLLLNKFHFIEYKGINNLYLFLLIFFVFKEYNRRMNFAGIIKSYPIVAVINIVGICGFIIYLINGN